MKSKGYRPKKEFTFLFLQVSEFRECHTDKLEHDGRRDPRADAQRHQGHVSETDYTWYTVLVPALMMMAGSGILSLMGGHIAEISAGQGIEKPQ